MAAKKKPFAPFGKKAPAGKKCKTCGKAPCKC